MTKQRGKLDVGGVSFAEDLEPEIALPSKWKDDPRWQLVIRIIASPGFSKSPKLTSFLCFVAQRSLTEPATQINEQSIGVEVFGRSSGYDSNDDNIVRSHASRLRLRLEAYFQSEGVNETLRVSIPKGSYAPTFYEVAQPQLPEVSHEIEMAGVAAQALDGKDLRVQADRPLGEGRQVPRFYWLLMAAICGVCIVATYLLTSYVQRRQLFGAPQANHALWQELLGGRQNTLIVNGDSSLVIYENASGKTLSIADYLAGNYRDEMLQEDKLDPHLLRTISRRRLTSIVDLDISNRILGRPEVVPGRAQLRYARDLHVDDLKGTNAIFIGSQEANPWIQLYSNALNFTIAPDQQTKIFTIRNRMPKVGEQAEYRSIPGDPERRAYATVAFVRTLDRTGHVLIIQGTGMAGTEAAADYVLSQDDLGSLLHTASSSGGALSEFELLLETSNLNGNAPTSKLIAVRVKEKE